MSDTDLQALPDYVYHLTVAPALQVAAELAANRGDPDLCNDMASMLALLTLVHDLGECYCRGRGADEVPEALSEAPVGTCVMVLQRAELAPEQISDCVWSLQAAETQLRNAGVIGPERELTERAWLHLQSDDRPQALEVLGAAAGSLVKAIDQWERTRE